MSNIYNKNSYQQALTVIPPQQNKSIICKADSGATKTYLKPTDQNILQNINKVINGPTVDIPHGENMKTISTLPLHNLLSAAAKQGNVLEELSNSTLLSIGQLCDNKCIAVFDKRHLHAFKHGYLIIKVQRNWTNSLWDVEIRPQQKLNVMIRKDKTKHDLAEYLHKCAFSSPLETFRKAIKKDIL